MTPTSFKKSFKEQFGFPLLSYAMETNKEMAENLVKETMNELLKENYEEMQAFWQKVKNGMMKYGDYHESMLNISRLNIRTKYMNSPSTILGFRFNEYNVFEVVLDISGTEITMQPIGNESLLFIPYKDMCKILKRVYPSYAKALEIDDELSNAFNAFLDASAKFISEKNSEDYAEVINTIKYKFFSSGVDDEINQIGW